MNPESYVVRIYRRDREHPERVEGILIAADSGGRHPFHSSEELLRLLSTDPEKSEARRGARPK